MASRRPVSPRKTPSQARSRELVDVLLKATARVLLREGYEGCTTNRVAEVAGVSIGSLYQYFPNKESLVVRVMERHQEKLRAVMAAHLEALHGATLAAAVKVLVQALLEALRVEPKLHRVFREQVPRIGALKALHDQNAAYEPLVTAWLEAHQDQVKVVDRAAATWVLIGAVDGVVARVLVDRPTWLEEARLGLELERLIVSYLTA
ncbi:MAG: TetR family transcriptional regulator [Myxococcaceae bacterium]|nr:TetR family transcriptional regulator [Myxococcaceae bacterium]